MQIIGPHGCRLDQERYVLLGEKYGSTEYSYYLFDDGTVWCFESPNNGYSPSRWYTVEPERFGQISFEDVTLHQLLAEHRY